MNNEEYNSEEILEAIARDRLVRKKTARESHLMFFHLYFPHYIKYEIADFQKEIFKITENADNKLACIVAFRGSGKSTLVTFSYALWSILGMQEKKFVLIICQTQAQAKQHMSNLKYELENNKLLHNDMGPFREEIGSESWAISSLVFKNTGARITIASIDQSIRGMRHHEFRPDNIILDDVENMASTSTREGRDKIFDWFTREIIPLGDLGTRIILLGNLLHEDSLMMRLKRKIDAKEISGSLHWFPLVDENGVCLWPGKFDTKEKIEELHRSVANELAWRQEYLLEILSDSTRVIHPEWIQYYDYDLYMKTARFDRIIIGIDLAISVKESADYTAMVAIAIVGYGSSMKAYVLPDIFHKHATYPEVIEEIKNICDSARKAGQSLPFFVVESNGFQEIYIETMASIGARVKGVKHMDNKRARIALTSSLIQSGQILFPKNNSSVELLITELTGFGRESNDDCADSFSTAILEMMEEMHRSREFEIWEKWVESNGGSCYI